MSESILRRVYEAANEFDANTISKDLHLLPKDMMVEWLDLKENEEPNSAKKPKLLVQERFGKVVTPEGKLEEYSKGFVPKNTESNTQWALRNFEAWRTWRNNTATDSSSQVPNDLLTCNDAGALNHWLSLFVIETKRNDGKEFPSKSIDLLLSGLKRYMVAQLKEKDPSVCPTNFLGDTDHRFAGLRGTRDRIARERRQLGIGAEVKHAEVISVDEEDKLWRMGTLGTTSPSSLLNAIFFNNGKILCLRGGEEHRRLKLSQFEFGSDEGGDYVVFVENGSKNRSGSYKDKAENKIIKQYAQPQLNERCYVNLLHCYMEKLPKVAFERDIFYWRPKESTSASPVAPWFEERVLGKATLAHMVKNMCAEAGIAGNKTNHSLRATGATRMFEGNVPEKIIQQRTGHRSVEALRTYQHTSVHQHKAVSCLLAAPKKSDFIDLCTPNPSPVTPEPSKVSPVDLTGPSQVPEPSAPTAGGAAAFHSVQGCTFNLSFNFGK